MFSLFDVGLSLSLVVLSLILSRIEKLGLEKEMLIAAARAFVQLMAVGFILQEIFRSNNVWLVLLMVTVMVTVAARTAARRVSELPDSFLIAAISIGLSVVLTFGLVWSLGIVDLTPRMLIPVVGIIISNSMNACALSMKRLATEIKGRRAEIEAALALGAKPRQAVDYPLKTAIRDSLIPAFNRTMTVGLVTLPGSMSGLILAGVSPLDAVKYQALIEYIVIGSDVLASISAALLAYGKFFTPHAQLKRMNTEKSMV